MNASPDKKELILDAARRLLVERGYQDIVLDQVAKHAGVAKGTLFLYYPSKDALLAAAFADLVDRLGAQIDEAAASGRSGEELLAGTVRVILGHFERYSDFLSQFGAGRFPGCKERSRGKLMDKLTANMKRVIAVLERCAAAGLFPARDLDVAAVSLFGLCRASIFLRVLGGSPTPIDTRTRQVLDLFLHGVKGRP
ncbi:MAG: TetR/AcrR family transcriptional regulator [Elusimicrobia bacterium]|nr:TetR/AcrR family transcriptional regulator [Elusimicrobiota bacterium]